MAEGSEQAAVLSRQIRTLRAAIGDAPRADEAFLLVAQHSGISVGDLALAMDVPQATVSGYVKALRGSHARKGGFSVLGRHFEAAYEIGQDRPQLVAQEIDPANPRRTALRLSPAGEALLAELLIAPQSAAARP